MAGSSPSPSLSQGKEKGIDTNNNEEHKTNPQQKVELSSKENTNTSNNTTIENSISYQHASRLVSKNIAALNALDQATKQSLLDLKTILRHQGAVAVRLQGVSLIESLTGDDSMCSILIATGIIYPLVDLLEETNGDVLKSALTALVNLVGSLAPEGELSSQQKQQKENNITKDAGKFDEIIRELVRKGVIEKSMKHLARSSSSKTICHLTIMLLNNITSYTIGSMALLNIDFDNLKNDNNISTNKGDKVYLSKLFQFFFVGKKSSSCSSSSSTSGIPEPDDEFEFIANILCNITQLQEGRNILLKRSNSFLPEILKVMISIPPPDSTSDTNREKNKVLLPSYGKYANKCRRLGLARCIRNLCFEVDTHWWLLNEVQIVPYILYGLYIPKTYRASNDNTQDEKNDEEYQQKLKEEVNELGELPQWVYSDSFIYRTGKKSENEDDDLEHLKAGPREKDETICSVLLEALVLLCSTRRGREKLGSLGTYPIMRDFDLFTQAFISAQGTLVSTSSSGPSSTESTTPYEESINQIVNFLKRDEEDEVVLNQSKPKSSSNQDSKEKEAEEIELESHETVNSSTNSNSNKDVASIKEEEADLTLLIQEQLEISLQDEEEASNLLTSLPERSTNDTAKIKRYEEVEEDDEPEYTSYNDLINSVD